MTLSLAIHRPTTPIAQAQRDAMTTGTINLNRSEPTLDARDLDLLIQQWLDDRQENTLPVTAAGYAEKIAYFRRWWAAVGPLQNYVLTRRDLLRFREYLESYPSTEQPLAYHTQKDILRRLRQMFKWADDEEITPDRNYAAWVPAPRGSAPLRVAATVETLSRLIDAIKAQTFNPDCDGVVARDLAIVAMLLGTGVRRAECVAVNIEDIQIDADNSGLAIIRKAKRVKGRDVQQRVVAFDPPTGDYLCDWLDTTKRTSGPLFVSFSDRSRGQRLTPVGVWKIVSKHVTAAGIHDQILRPCHDLRVAFATCWERNRKGQAYDHLLSKQLGHSNYRMTTHYVRLDTDDIRHEMISPFALIEANKKAGTSGK